MVHDLNNTTSSVKHGGHGHVTGRRSVVFMDDVTAERSSRTNSEVFKALLSARIQSNSAKLIR